MSHGSVTAFAIVLVLAASAGCTQEGHDDAARKAVGFLLTQQNGDGGFSAQAGGDSDLSTSAWVALALGATDTTGPTRDRLLAYLGSRADEVDANATGSFSATNAAALLVVAGYALDDPPRAFAGTDPGGRLEADAKNQSLGFNEKIFVTGALGRAGRAPAAAALVTEIKVALDDADHEFLAKDAWFRANAILALIAAGEDDDSEAMRRWAQGLLPFQEHDAGFRGSLEYSADASTTASVVAVLRQVPFVYSHEREAGSAFLETLRQPDGSVKFSRDADFARIKTTAEAVLGWTGKGPFQE